MKRKIYNELLKWKNERNGEVALQVEGARRIGKNKCISKYSQYISSPTVIHTGDYKTEDGITYLPIYMTPLMYIANGNLIDCGCRF